jgi:hypothetical protein
MEKPLFLRAFFVTIPYTSVKKKKYLGVTLKENDKFSIYTFDSNSMIKRSEKH